MNAPEKEKEKNKRENRRKSDKALTDKRTRTRLINQQRWDVQGEETEARFLWKPFPPFSVRRLDV